MTTATREEIAIIGIGCRFPGGADSAESFWRLLRDGVDAISEMPADRPQLSEVYDPDPTKPGRSYLRRGGFVPDVDKWDAAFFGISPREAQHIDPQHRLLLEVAWEALEDAGHDAEHLAGSRTGVFVGISTHDYGDMTCDPVNRALLDTHSNSGSATSIAANRISYLYDLRGPSMTVDTACSSSLTAAHLACTSLLAGECDLAIVGGVQLQLNPELTIGFCKAGMISPDGECRAFDASANGYVRSEGAGAVVLKPLRAALADGDRVYAVIAGTAVNQDGRTTGMTVPSRLAQEALLREALATAGIAPTDVHYVEAHGTGTPVGDPIEAGALAAVLREGRSDRCPIGSVKTNIGHLEAGSGIAGLIKATLCVQRREIPPSLHYRHPNPALDLEGGRLRVVTALEPWPSRARATAAVNSFGFGGANAHAIVREAPAPATPHRPSAPGEAIPGNATLIPIGARSDAALDALAKRYMDLLTRSDAPPLVEVASSAAHRRAHHDRRIAIVATTRDDAVDALDAAVAGESRATLARGRVADAGTVGFVFAGMGPQWWGMGQQLRATNGVFREMLERCHDALLPHAPWKLLDELARDEATSRVSEPDLAQVTNFAIQVAIAEVLRSWGIVPDAVVGHSAGEMAAAYAAGALSLDDAVKVAYHRSRLQAEALPGKILAIGLPAAEVERRIADYGGELDLAAVNSPVSCTVAGGTPAIESLFARLQEEQVFARVLSFAVPYHSAKMDPIRDALNGALADVRARSGTIPVYSTALGGWIDGARLGGDYWFENVRRTVRFADGVEALFEGGHRTLLEISPHPVLTASINECLGARKARATVLGTLRRKEDERASLLRSAAQLWVQGRTLDWDGVFDGRRSNVPLPTYPWQRERHWLETGDRPPAPEAGAGENAAAHHPLLGRRVRAPQPLWDSSLAGDRLAYLDDHLIQGTVVFPGAAYLEMALAAARAVRGGDQPLRIQRVTFKRALFIADRSRAVLQLVADAAAGRFEVHSAVVSSSDLAWTLHADGEIGAAAVAEASRFDRGAALVRCGAELPHDACYEALARRGLEYGPAFRGIARAWTGRGEAIGRIEVPNQPGAPRVDAASYELHPALLDAALQLLICASGGTAAGDAAPDGVFLPVALRDLALHARAGDAFWADARVTSQGTDAVEGDVTIADDDGRVLAELRGLRCQRIADARRGEGLDDWLYELRWERRALAGAAQPAAVAVDLGDLEARLCADADRASAARRWGDYYAQLERRLDDVAAAYMARAVRTLAERAGGASFGLDTLGVAPAQRSMARHVLGALERRGIVARSGDQWAPRWESTAVPHPSALAAAIVAEHPAYAVVLELVARSGEALADVLSGAVDAASLLFGDGGELVARFYREAPPSSLYNDLVARAVSDVVRSAAATRPVRIVEVGGGTGGTTAEVLPLLDPARTEYVFTDLSPRFVDDARERFAGPSFAARTLDVEREPSAQGIEPGTFDLVLAANVLHATASVANTLANVRSLLAPGGLLVLLEITRGPLWIDLVFGLTEGWWRFADRDLRPSHPLLDAGRWASALAAAGFDAVAALRDTPPDGEAAQSVLVARAAAAVSPAVQALGDWVLLADRGGIATALAARLTTAGARTIVIEPGDAFAVAGDDRFTLPVADAAAAGRLLSALHDAGVEPRGIVSLWALDADRESSSGDALLAAQRAGVGGALGIVQALAARATSGALPSLWLVTAGAQPTGGSPSRLALTQAPVWGFGRVITKEQPALHTRLVDLSLAPAPDEIASLAREIAAGDWEDELALRGGDRLVRRLHRVPAAELPEPLRTPSVDEAYRAEIDTAGALETLSLRGCDRRRPTAGEVEVAVQAAALNFRDVMIAMGLQPSHNGEPTFGRDLLGLDFAGVVTAVGDGVADLAVGDAVAGIGPGTFASHVTTPAAVVARRPRGLTVAEASGIPSVFVTAHYSLRHLARLRAGERVLIHAATGGVGLAAIQVARDVGARILATAGSPEKRRHLERLGIAHAMDSRTLSWADEVMERTGGEGVDVVLNSLAGEAIPRGIGVLRPYGRFVEIGKRDIYQDRRIGLLAFRQNLAFFGVDVDLLSLQRPDVAHEMLVEVVDRFERGVYTPLPYEEFPLARVEEAMRFMQQAKHVGKIVLRLDERPPAVRPSRRGKLFRDDATYLITGGLGGFGLAVAEWMRREGAGAVALMGRSAPSAEADARIALLRRDGMRVEVVRGDVTRRDDVRAGLALARATMPALRGVVHAAMVLDDAPITELDLERLDRVMAPKAIGAWNLDAETTDDALDYFVMFSSLTSTFGNPLQANYAAANAYLDALAHHRRAQGRHALAVNWGPLAQVGYVSRHRDVAEYLERQGYGAFTPEQAFEVLATLLRRDAAHMTAARIDWARWAESAPAAASSAMLRQFAPSRAPGAARGAESDSLRGELAALGADERRARVLAFLRERVGKVLGISPAKLADDRPLTTIGFDSLIAVELLTVLHMQLGVELPAVKILQGATIEGLATLVLEQLGAGTGEPAALPVRAPRADDGPPLAARAGVAAVPLVAAATSGNGPEAVASNGHSASGNGAHPHSGNGHTQAGDAIAGRAAGASGANGHAEGARPPAPAPMTGSIATASSLALPHPRRAARATPEFYAALDYSRWGAGQRVVRGLVGAGVRAVARLDVAGLEHLPRTGGCILAINHLSMADVPVVLSVLPRRTIMLASDHLRQSRMMDWFLSDLGDAIYVRRGEGDVDALERGLAVLRAGGMLGLGPEGTRSREGALTVGRTGIAYLAAQAGVPIVPLAAWGQERMPSHWRAFRRAPVAVRVGEPIRLGDGATDATRLREHTDRVMRAIAAMLPAEYRGVYADAGG